MSKHLYTYINPTNEKDLKQALQFLENGGVIAYPTDVNWAMGCDPRSKKAIEKIRRIKTAHPKEQPFSLICNSISMASNFATIDQFAYRYLKKIFPGSYTVLLNRSKNFPKIIDDKRQLVGIRVIKSPLLDELIRLFDFPILTTSCPEIDGEKITFGYQIEESFGHAIDLILDLGEEVLPYETTILDLSESTLKVVRRGVGEIFGA